MKIVSHSLNIIMCVECCFEPGPSTPHVLIMTSAIRLNLTKNSL